MNKLENVRVRYAPSPTGYIHIGNLRTALFNYLFARHHNGVFVLRIEDTDQARKVEGAVENLIHSLNLLGIDYDEGPFKGGPYGPYFQSQRLDIYRRYCNELLEKGWAYYAFETPEELEEMRRLQQIEGRQTMYDRRARSLMKSEVEKLLKEGKPYVIRLKVPLDDEVKFEDVIKGTVRIETNLIDDQILLKSDGFPTYHLANVIDDHLMKITHIIRGEEWVTSVPKHILIYKALGWEPPVFAHVPLLLNPDKTKLSKRQGDVAVEDYLRKGYLREALINFIALLGWNPGEGEENEFFSMQELIQRFSLERVHSAGAVFNVQKLDWMNNEYIRRYDIDSLMELALPFLEVEGIDTSDKLKIKKILNVVRVYVNKLSELPQHFRMFFVDEIEFENPDYLKVVRTDTSKRVFEELILRLQNISELTAEIFKKVTQEIQNATGIKGKNLFKPIRLALTGKEHGPELPLVAELLGKDKVIKFLSQHI
ncbi:MAG: glutamate--tRNA ligase [Ignavibacteria bacterium]